MTTFYPIGLHFGRSAKPQPLSRFLKGSIDAKLRFCPRCVQEQGYYSLFWRFKFLRGCGRHRCELAECCPHCKKPIPLLPPLLRIGICPTCRRNFTQLPTRSLNRKLLEIARENEQTLKFFLDRPPRSEQNDSTLKMVGARFAQLRHDLQVNRTDVASQSGISRSALEGIERFNLMRWGTSFLAYWLYADFLGVRLEALF